MVRQAALAPTDAGQPGVKLLRRNVPLMLLEQPLRRQRAVDPDKLPWRAASLCCAFRAAPRGRYEPCPFPSRNVQEGAAKSCCVAGSAQEDEAMARYCSTRDFLRKVPNAVLADYFRVRGLPCNVDFAAMQEAQTLCRDAEQYKALSQNMGHDGVLTTFLSYGVVEPRQQGCRSRLTTGHRADRRSALRHWAQPRFFMMFSYHPRTRRQQKRRPRRRVDADPGGRCRV